MNIIFAGTPDIAVPLLKVLCDTPAHQVLAVYTQPDRPKGRGRKLIPSPIKALAIEEGIPVEQPLNFKASETKTQLAAYKPDIMVVMAYGLLLPQDVLETPKYGCINAHVSLLPRHRGAAPIQHAILAGDTQTGVSIMQMDRGMDTGPVFSQATYEISPHDTAATLHDQLANLTPKLVLTTLEAIEHGDVTATPQDDKYATYAPKIQKADAKLNWEEQSETLCRKIRAYNPWPGAYIESKREPIKLWAAHPVTFPTNNSHTPGTILQADKRGMVVKTGDGALNITIMQLPNKRALPIADILNAHKAQFQAGKIL